MKFKVTGILFFTLFFAAAQSNLSKLEKLKEKHRGWQSALIVAAGDTTHVRIKPNKMLKTLAEPDMFALHTFTIAFDNEKEKLIHAEQYAALILPEGTFISINTGQGGGYQECNIYKVISDGACQLLFSPYRETAYMNGETKMDFIFMNLSNGTYVDNNLFHYNDRRDLLGYWIYYKNTMWKPTMRSHDFSNPIIGPAFRKNMSHKIFADCPALVETLENNTFRTEDLREIVKDFNQCRADENAYKKTIPVVTVPQIDSSAYTITLNNGTQFDCELLEEKKGDHIKVKREDGAVLTLNWDSFKDYKLSGKRKK